MCEAASDEHSAKDESQGVGELSWRAVQSLVTKVICHPLKWGQRAVLNLRAATMPLSRWAAMVW